MTTRDPSWGMPDDVRADFEKAPAHVRDAYLKWWPERANKASAHRDTWPAYKAAWGDLSKMVRRALA